MINIMRIATIGLTALSLALPVGVFAQEERPDDANRSIGQIASVDPGQASFTLAKRDGEQIEFLTGERTRFRGEGVESLEDLEPAMRALVVWAEGEDGRPFALAVAARRPGDRPQISRYAGEITGVVPGQGTFTMATREGQELEFSTGERTRFHSRDGSVQDIHDLKKGMHAMVGAVQTDDGSLLALVVAVGSPGERPKVDVRAFGEVTAVHGRSFTLTTRGGEQLTVAVNESTKFKGIGGLDELQVGMLAGVGAVETDSGLLAVWVGARHPREDRPQPDSERRPDSRPVPPSENGLEGDSA